jgi:hypothetical protein
VFEAKTGRQFVNPSVLGNFQATRFDLHATIAMAEKRGFFLCHNCAQDKFPHYVTECTFPDDPS